MKNIRTCIACRQKFDKTKHNFIKLSTKDDIISLNDNSAFGRSYYICNDECCVKKVIKNKILNKVLKKQVNEEIYDKIKSL